MDIRRHIAENPWSSVGFAALAGIWLGALGKAREPELPRGYSEIVFAALGAIALRLVREAALKKMTEIAGDWWRDHGSHPEQPSA